MAEFSIFRMAVYAAVLLALIYLAVSFFILPKERPSDSIGKMLQIAEGNEGRYFDKEIYFGSEGIISAKAFENYSRSIALKCISPVFCTPDIVVFDERSASFKKSIALKVSARCVYEVNLYKCALYLGKNPAQVIVSKTAVSDANDGISFEIKNEGSLGAENIISSVVIYKKIIVENEAKEIKYAELEPKITPLLRPGEKETLSFDFGILEKGSYSAKIKSWADEAGFDKGEGLFMIEKNAVDSCAAGEFAETSLVMGKCRERYGCSGCGMAYKCRGKWAEKMPEKAGQFLVEDKDYTIIEYAPDAEGNCTAG